MKLVNDSFGGIHTVTDETIAKIKALLFSGELERGQKMPSEVSLAERFGVGRSSVREALRQLAAAGYIELIPNRGAFAAVVDENQIPSPICGAASWLQLNSDAVNELLEVRACIEPLAAELCAKYIDKDGLSSLHNELEQFELASEKGDTDLEAQLDYRFHKLILEFSRNKFLIGMYEQLLQLFMQYSSSSFRAIPRQRSTLTEHRMIYDAIAAGSATEARYAMQHHIAIANRRLQTIGDENK